MDAKYYSTVATKIASFGYIVAVPNAPRIVMFGAEVQLTSPNATLAARALLRTLASSRSSGMKDRLIDNSFAIVGHSFGGVMAIVAGANDAPTLCAGEMAALCSGYTGFGRGLKAVVTYGSSMVDRSRLGGVTIFNPNTAGVPNILIRGKNDGRVTLEDVSTTYYDVLETPKAFIEIDDANHFGITDSQEIVGGSNDPNPQPRPQDWSTTAIANVIVVALDAHVKNNRDAHSNLYTRKELGYSYASVTASKATQK